MTESTTWSTCSFIFKFGQVLGPQHTHSSFICDELLKASSSRMLSMMAKSGQAPRIFGVVNKKGKILVYRLRSPA